MLESAADSDPTITTVCRSLVSVLSYLSWSVAVNYRMAQFSYALIGNNDR